MKKKVLIYCLLLLTTHISFGQEIKPYRIGIVVENLEKSSNWYSNIFEAEVYKEVSYPEFDSLTIHLLKNEYFEFELVERKSSISIHDVISNYNVKEKPLLGIYKVSFQVDDIQKIYNRIKKEKIEFHMDLSTDEEFKMKSFIIKDPDNNLLQFQENIDN